MQRDVAMAQANTIREMADGWERDALAGDAEGYGEVVFLMRRAARAIEKAVGIASAPDGAEHQRLPKLSDTLDTRSG